MSVQLNVNIDTSNYNCNEEMIKVAHILKNENMKTVDKLRNTAESFFKTAHYAGEKSEECKKLTEETQILKKEKQELLEKQEHLDQEINAYVEDSAKSDKEFQMFKKKTHLQNRAKEIIESKKLYSGLSDIGSSILSRISSVSLLSIIGIPLAIPTMLGHNYLQKEADELESYIWALENFPESLENDEIMQKAQRIGHRQYIKKIRNELLEDGFKENFINSTKIVYIDDHCRLYDSQGRWVKMLNMYSLSQEEREEVEEIEKVSIDREWKDLSDFVDKNFYK